ncbi:hypothetical protein Tco_0617745 [Tanacetum coccineum]
MYIMTSLPRTLIPTRPGLGSMATPVITISSDVSEKSVRSIVSRVILFDTIPTEPADELPERHVSLGPFSAMVSMWKAKVISRPSSLLGSPLRDIVVPFAGPVGQHFHLRHHHPVLHQIQHNMLQRVLLPPLYKVHTDHFSKVVCSPSGPLTCRRPQCSDYATPTSCSYAGLCSDYVVCSPSGPLTCRRPQCSDYATPTSFHTAGSLSPAQADLLPPHKRYRGTSAAHSHESSDEGSPETHMKSDMDSNIRADIKAEIAAAASTVAAIVDGGVDTGFEPGLVVVKSESKPKEVEADDETDAEIRPKDTIEIEVDVTMRMDIPNDLPMLDTIE